MAIGTRVRYKYLKDGAYYYGTFLGMSSRGIIRLNYVDANGVQVDLNGYEFGSMVQKGGGCSHSGVPTDRIEYEYSHGQFQQIKKILRKS